MKARAEVLLFAAAAATMGCSAIVGDYEVGEGPGEGISTARLCEIERQVYAFEIDLDSTTHEVDLSTYYEIANPELTAHLAALTQAYSSATPEAGVTYIMGAAGVGKSFAMRNLGGFADTEQCGIDLAELFNGGGASLGFTVVQAPDVATVGGEVTFNELPTIESPLDFDLTTFLAAAGCEVAGTLLPLIAIDGLDEIHPDSSPVVLEAIDRFILDGAVGAGPFVHFVVAGRPEAFKAWLTDPGRTSDNSAIEHPFTLQGPRYETAGDIDYRVREYLDYSGQLPGLEASGQLDDYIASVTNAVARHPFLTYSMGNLAIGNIAIEHTKPGANEAEPQIKAGLFDDIIERAAATHGLPDAGGALSGPYLRMLEEIAARYVLVGDDGVFEVLSEDRLQVLDDTGSVLGEARVRDVLDRAGVALLASPFATDTRYHFEPFWVHAHLVERYNQRTIPGYVYRTCE